MTTMRICYLVADYYITHQEWPATKEHLEEQNRMELSDTEALSKTEGAMSAEEVDDALQFLERFTFIKLKKRGTALELHYQFNVDKTRVTQTVVFTPGTTAEEILKSSTGTERD